jgi:hypothetical protein
MAKTKALSEILKRLGIGVKAARPSVKATRPALKAKPKVSRRTGRKKDTGPVLSKPTAGAGRGKVQAQTPSVKATRPTLKAKPKVSRTTGRKKPASTAVTTTKPSAVTKQPGTAVAKRPSTAVARRQSRTGRSTAVTTPKGAGPDKIVGLSNKGKAALAAGLAAVGTGTYMGLGDDKKSAKAGPTTPKYKTKEGGPGRQAPSKKAAQPSGPSTRGSAKRGATKPISAGPNTGFGPKGNQFPGNAEERAALMKMYGGTGSAAAKAAIAGKQGNLAAGKADYEAARIKRLKAASSTGDRKKGGKVGTKSNNNSVVARQMRGWGKARKR